MQASASPDLLIRHRFAALTKALPGARQGDPHAVHQARVATRRLRAALPLVDARRPRRRLQRRVRRLTRTLGPIRELDVALQILDELEREERLRGAVACLRTAISDERERLLVSVGREIDRADIRTLQKKALKAVVVRSKSVRKPPVRRTRTRAVDHARVPPVRRRTAARGLALRSAIENAAGIYLPDRLHEVRIAAKKLRYAMEVLRELTGSRATARLVKLKAAQDLLGRMHDFEVLIARTRSVQGSTMPPSLRLSADLDLLVRRLETECRQLHGHYMASRAALLAICDFAVSQADQPGRAAA